MQPVTLSQETDMSTAKRAQQDSPKKPRSQQQQQADGRRDADAFRDERSPAQREMEEADRGAPDDIIPCPQPPGWTARD
jgi:hypothetical protein